MHLVRSILSLIVCSLSVVCSAQSLSPPDTEGPITGRVEIALNQSVKRHSRSTSIRDVCRAGHEVKGCTDFPEEVLECDCALQKDRWVINASARLEAVIHLSANYTNNRILLHEQAHLTDLETSLRQHLGGIVSETYQSEKACRTFAKVLSESPHLRIVMNKMRVASNKKLGCAPKGAY